MSSNTEILDGVLLFEFLFIVQLSIKIRDCQNETMPTIKNPIGKINFSYY